MEHDGSESWPAPRQRSKCSPSPPPTRRFCSCAPLNPSLCCWVPRPIDESMPNSSSCLASTRWKGGGRGGELSREEWHRGSRNEWSARQSGGRDSLGRASPIACENVETLLSSTYIIKLLPRFVFVVGRNAGASARPAAPVPQRGPGALDLRRCGLRPRTLAVRAMVPIPFLLCGQGRP